MIWPLVALAIAGLAWDAFRRALAERKVRTCPVTLQMLENLQAGSIERLEAVVKKVNENFESIEKRMGIVETTTTLRKVVGR